MVQWHPDMANWQSCKIGTIPEDLDHSTTRSELSELSARKAVDIIRFKK